MTRAKLKQIIREIVKSETSRRRITERKMKLKEGVEFFEPTEENFEKFDLDFSAAKIGKDGSVSYNDVLKIDGKLTGGIIPFKFKDCSDWFWADGVNSLEGAPQKVGGDFKLTNYNGTDFKGGPSKIGGEIEIQYAKNLSSMKDAPSKVTKITIERAALNSFKDMPKAEHYVISGCPISSFDGLPNKVGYLWVRGSGIKSFDGIPKNVGFLNIVDCPLFDKHKKSLSKVKPEVAIEWLKDNAGTTVEKYSTI